MVLIVFIIGGALLLLMIRAHVDSQFGSETDLIIKSLSDISSDDNIYIDDFLKFVKEYDRKYAGNLEMVERFKNFAKNMKYIHQIQQNRDNVVFGITRFADWSEEEMKALTCEYPPANILTDALIREDIDFAEEAFGRNDSMDWRTRGVVTDVKDQKRCGSCWAFGAVGVIESMHALANNTLISLSEQELVDCDLTDNGCNGGYRPYAFHYVRRNGIVSDKEYPYMGEEQQCKPKGERVYVKRVQYVRRNEDAMANFIFYKGPISVGINVTKSMFHYKAGVLTTTKEECEQDAQGTHALAVVGYGNLNGEDYWLIKNSWGKQWGIDGYFMYKRGINACGIANDPYSVTV